MSRSRSEIKYELDRRSAENLSQIVGRYLPLFEFRQGYSFTYVTSVYFDTDRLDFYQRASASLEDNVKVRVRDYSYREAGAEILSIPYCFLEIKRRAKGRVEKKRLRVLKPYLNAVLKGKEIWDELVAADPESDSEAQRAAYAEARRFLGRYTLLPRSAIRYRRRVYQRDEQELRITFDDELKIFSPKADLYGSSETLEPRLERGEPRPLDKVIMEIKYHKLCPDWVEGVLNDFVPCHISKFTTSMSTLVG